MGNATSFCRFSLRELSADGPEGVPAYVLLARVLEDEGYLNHDEQIPRASGVRPRVLGTLDSLGGFFEELDAVVQVANDPDKLAFLLWAPSRGDVRQYWERLPPPAQALAKAGALVFRREEFFELKDALQRTEEGSELREDLRFILEGPAPESDEIDVWLTQGVEPIELGALSDERGGKPPPTLRVNAADAFERKLVLVVLGVVGLLAMVWQIFF